MTSTATPWPLARSSCPTSSCEGRETHHARTEHPEGVDRSGSRVRVWNRAGSQAPPTTCGEYRSHLARGNKMWFFGGDYTDAMITLSADQYNMELRATPSRRPPMTDSVLLVEQSEGVATLTLNRPSSKNALSPDLVEALRSVVPRIVADDSVRAVVLTGAGGAFSSGADLKTGLSAAGAAPVSGLLEALHSVIRCITTARQPFIAAVGGAAVGFGCDLALSCDLRVVSTEGYFQEIFVKIGLMPDGGGTFLLPRLVGLGRALEYMMLGRRIDATLAENLGIANRVVGPAKLAEEAKTLALELAAAPPLALARIKKTALENATGTLDQALDRERASQLELLASQDLLEGVTAWAQKRPPAFQGR